MAGNFTKIQYDETCELARQLASIGGECDGVAGKTDNLVSTINSGWEGTSADAMNDVLIMWKNKEKKIAENMRAISGQIKMVADALLAADDDSAQRNINA